MTLDLPDFTKAMGGIDKDGNPIQKFNEPPVWFHDDFEDILKWRGGGGTTVHLIGYLEATVGSPINAGNAGMRITTAVGGAGNAQRWIGCPPTSGNIGISMSFSFNTKSNFNTSIGYNMPIQFILNTGDIYTSGRLAYVPTTGKWYITEDNTSTWIEVLTKSLRQNYVVHNIKLVINIDTSKYVSLIVNDENVDLSAYSLHAAANPTDDYCELQPAFNAASTKTAIIWIDDVKVTYNEP